MPFLVYFVLFLSLHACSARRLGVAHEKVGRKIHNTKVQPEELQAQVNPITEISEVKTLETSALANSPKEKDLKAIIKEDNNQGRQVAVSYSQEDSQEVTKFEGWRRQARSTLGSEPHDAGEALNSKEDPIEDIVVMDYAQPHRKPPIHNKKP